jgi:hypothetical protein
LQKYKRVSILFCFWLNVLPTFQFPSVILILELCGRWLTPGVAGACSRLCFRP